MKSEYKLLGLNDTSSENRSGSIFVTGVLVPLSKVDVLKKIEVAGSKHLSKKAVVKKATEIMANFPYKVIEVTAEQVGHYYPNDLGVKAFYDIYKALGDEKTVVYAENSDDEKETFIKRLEKINCPIDEDHWVIDHCSELKYLPCSAASIVAMYFDFTLEGGENK
jgi:ribonuclease HII